jgi:hypothetical protein
VATCWTLSLGLYLLAQRIVARTQTVPAPLAQGEAA